MLPKIEKRKTYCRVCEHSYTNLTAHKRSKLHMYSEEVEQLYLENKHLFNTLYDDCIKKSEKGKITIVNDCEIEE